MPRATKFYIPREPTRLLRQRLPDHIIAQIEEIEDAVADARECMSPGDGPALDAWRRELYADLERRIHGCE